MTNDLSLLTEPQKTYQISNTADFSPKIKVSHLELLRVHDDGVANRLEQLVHWSTLIQYPVHDVTLPVLVQPLHFTVLDSLSYP